VVAGEETDEGLSRSEILERVNSPSTREIEPSARRWNEVERMHLAKSAEELGEKKQTRSRGRRCRRLILYSSPKTTDRRTADGFKGEGADFPGVSHFFPLNQCPASHDVGFTLSRARKIPVNCTGFGVGRPDSHNCSSKPRERGNPRSHP